jgi:hypothetical protein
LGPSFAKNGRSLQLLSATQAVLWLAREAGSFQRHGLDVELIYIGTVVGFRLALESLSDEPRARTAKPEEFYDDSILRHLEREGFFQQLYR